MAESFVYILASRRNGTLYVGSTTDLVKRIWEHKNNFISGFTAKYNVHQLVYYEMHQTIMEAARRERRLKNWCRKWKLTSLKNLILCGEIYMKKLVPNWIPRTSRGTTE